MTTTAITATAEYATASPARRARLTNQARNQTLGYQALMRAARLFREQVDEDRRLAAHEAGWRELDIGLMPEAQFEYAFGSAVSRVGPSLYSVNVRDPVGRECWARFAGPPVDEQPFVSSPAAAAFGRIFTRWSGGAYLFDTATAIYAMREEPYDSCDPDDTRNASTDWLYDLDAVLGEVAAITQRSVVWGANPAGGFSTIVITPPGPHAPTVTNLFRAGTDPDEAALIRLSLERE